MYGLVVSSITTLTAIVLGFYINLYFGLFLTIWVIVSIAYIIANLGNKYGPGHWYDWPIGIPAVVIACIWGTVDSLTKKYEKK